MSARVVTTPWLTKNFAGGATDESWAPAAGLGGGARYAGAGADGTASGLVSFADPRNGAWSWWSTTARPCLGSRKVQLTCRRYVSNLPRWVMVARRQRKAGLPSIARRLHHRANDQAVRLQRRIRLRSSSSIFLQVNSFSPKIKGERAPRVPPSSARHHRNGASTHLRGRAFQRALATISSGCSPPDKSSRDWSVTCNTQIDQAARGTCPCPGSSHGSGGPGSLSVSSCAFGSIVDYRSLTTTGRDCGLGLPD